MAVEIKGFHKFPKDISPKVKVIALQKFELTMMLLSSIFPQRHGDLPVNNFKARIKKRK